MFRKSRKKAVKITQEKTPKDKENTVKSTKRPKKTITVISSTASDDYIKNLLDIDDRQVEQIRNICDKTGTKPRVKSSVEEEIENKEMASSL